MKHTGKILLIALALCATTAALVIFYKTRSLSAGDELSWLNKHFQIRQEDQETVRELHRVFSKECQQMCAKIEASNKHLDELILKNKEVTPEIVTAVNECSKIQSECHLSMLKHFYAVSSHMPPEDGHRYLTEMKGCIIDPPAKSPSH